MHGMGREGTYIFSHNDWGTATRGEGYSAQGATAHLPATLLASPMYVRSTIGAKSIYHDYKSRLVYS